MGILDDYMLLLFIFLLFFGTLFTLFKLLSKALLEIKADFTHRETPELPNFDELKTNLLDLVHDTISEMQPPTAIDHLMGIISQYAQAKMMKMMDIDPSQLLETVTEGLNDS